MQRVARDLESFEVRALDGRIGRVVDLLFDVRRWAVRYVVADTGTWLNHREVLIPSACVHPAPVRDRALPVDLTREQIRRRPQIDTQMPVSGQQELARAHRDRWRPAADRSGPALAQAGTSSADERSEAWDSDPMLFDEPHHLRSTAEIRGHRIEANDGPIGHAEDVIVDEETWTVQLVVVDLRLWWAGKRVVVSPEWIYQVGWADPKIYIDLSRDEIQRSPPYDGAIPVISGYMERLRQDYGRPRRTA